MKKLAILLIAVVFAAVQVNAQCTPTAATGSPGITPVTDSLPCAVFNEPYNETIFVENFATQVISGATVTMNFLRVDSVTNLPCGMTYQLNPANGQLGSGATGCLQISGTSTDAIGQYRANLYITLSASALVSPIPFPIPLDFSGEAASVIAQVENLVGQSLGIDFNYFIRLKQNAADPCPAIDRTGNNDLTAQAVCPSVGNLSVTITGDNSACEGDSVTLTANATAGVAPLSYLWSTGDTSSSIRAEAGASYSVRVIDGVPDTGNATFAVGEVFAPEASFTYTVDSNRLDVVSNSSGSAATLTWDFGGAGTGSGAATTYSFTANGTYDIVLTATNNCGSDDTTIAVTISDIVIDTSTGINSVANSKLSVNLYPNPNQGVFTVELSATRAELTAVTVVNLQGQVVKTVTENVNVGKNAINLNLHAAPAGIYIVKVENGAGTSVSRLIVE